MSELVEPKTAGGAPEIQADQVEHGYDEKIHAADLDLGAKATDYRQDAMDAENEEHRMGVMEAVRAYPMASFWAFVFSCTIVSLPSIFQRKDIPC